MRLATLLERAAVVPTAASGRPGDTEVTSVAYDSRAVRPGALFCCVPGSVSDGHRFAGAAVAAGATAVLAERPIDPPVAVPVVQVPGVRAAMGPIAATLAGDPSRSLDVVGITGTNGKTTTAALVASVSEAAGRPCEVVGTLTGTRTTPEAPDLQDTLGDAVQRGARTVALEVSSHALDQHRVDGTRVAVAVFTNLSRDHLDYHASMEAYFRAKARLFSPELAERAVVNLDDPHGRLLADAAEIPTEGYSLAEVDDLSLRVDGSAFRWRGHPVSLSLPGRFNVANALAAAHATAALGIDDATIAAGLSAPVAVPGRMERVDAGQPFTVLVDYAHTPDGLEQVLAAARDLTGADGRVVVVFGCGGDRDRQKRPLMGAAAERLADRVVVTADNSRHEPTDAIIEAILGGMSATGRRRALVEPDRARAIAAALDVARPGDVVVVAGKGHETTLTIGDTVADFDDRAVVRHELGRFGAAS